MSVCAQGFFLFNVNRPAGWMAGPDQGSLDHKPPRQAWNLTIARKGDASIITIPSPAGAAPPAQPAAYALATWYPTQINHM
jgi:hypothetical protein